MKLSNRIAHLFGITEDTRQNSVTALFLATERHPMSYWMQLLIAAGIAYFGLVLNSTAVVIGAMLVSPLMTPIVQLGMSFTIGDLYFATKSFLNIIASVLLIIIIAALLTQLLPFQDVTPEIIARTKPTAFDLIIAILCGLAASFTTAKSSKDTVTAAAGTAIAIALVPPVCVIGYGVGIRSWNIAFGAALLFTANLGAIILVNNLFFLVVGFSKIDVQNLEDKVLDNYDFNSVLYKITKSIKISTAIHRWRSFRIALPLLFVAIIFVPLSKTLKIVAWEINVKNSMNRLLKKEKKLHKVINFSYNIIHETTPLFDDPKGFIEMQMTIVGEPEIEKDILSRLNIRLAAVSGSKPELHIDIIPSNEAVDKRLKKSKEWINTLAFSKDKKDHVKCETDAEILDQQPISLFADKVKNSFLKVVEWMKKNDPNSVIVDWSVSFGEKNTLHIIRISDIHFTPQTKSLLEGIIKKDTGMEIIVNDYRYPKTLFAFDKINKKELQKLYNDLQTISENEKVLIYCTIPKSPDSIRDKKRFGKMNKKFQNIMEKFDINCILDDGAARKWMVELRARQK